MSRTRGADRRVRRLRMLYVSWRGDIVPKGKGGEIMPDYDEEAEIDYLRGEVNRLHYEVYYMRDKLDTTAFKINALLGILTACILWHWLF